MQQPRLLACLAAAHAFGPPTTRRLPRTTRRAEGEKTRLDAIDELLPRFRRDAGAVDLPKDEETPSVEGATMGTVNDKLLAEIEEAKKGFRVEAPQVDEREDAIFLMCPIQSVLSGVAALATAYVFGWRSASRLVRGASGGQRDLRDSAHLDGHAHGGAGPGTLLTGITAFAGVGPLALGGGSSSTRQPAVRGGTSSGRNVPLDAPRDRSPPL